MRRSLCGAGCCLPWDRGQQGPGRGRGEAWLTLGRPAQRVKTASRTSSCLQWRRCGHVPGHSQVLDHGEARPCCWEWVEKDGVPMTYPPRVAVPKGSSPTTLKGTSWLPSVTQTDGQDSSPLESSFPEALFKGRCTLAPPCTPARPCCELPARAPRLAGGSQVAPVLSPSFKVLRPSCAWSLPGPHDGLC